jgi:hypothetical protein
VSDKRQYPSLWGLKPVEDFVEKRKQLEIMNDLNVWRPTKNLRVNGDQEA